MKMEEETDIFARLARIKPHQQVTLRKKEPLNTGIETNRKTHRITPTRYLLPMFKYY